MRSATPNIPPKGSWQHTMYDIIDAFTVQWAILIASALIAIAIFLSSLPPHYVFTTMGNNLVLVLDNHSGETRVCLALATEGLVRVSGGSREPCL
jgi:hypothetical protein